MFVPRKTVIEDCDLKGLVDIQNITIPLIWIKGSLYLVGDRKVNLEKNGEFICANVGGGW